MSEFDEFRKSYECLEYKGYFVEYVDGTYKVRYDFSIPGLREFQTKWEFPAKERRDGALLDTLFFHLGIAESLSYWKCVCPRTVKILCGTLTDWQRAWWKKLYYYGLGEFMYRNGIEAEYEDFVEIRCAKGGMAGNGRLTDTGHYAGCMIPVGGGKDSVVSLELLRDWQASTFSINRNETVQNVIDVFAGTEGDILTRRTLDPGLLELNAQGFLNGHTPFSSIVAFSSYIAAYLNGKKYIALSNETSANETTVEGSFVNHQYSKSYGFEQDFREYMDSVVTSEIYYFSFLRPLTELQITWLFSENKKYHKVFRSCNVGSKKNIWCCNCPKCLFVYIMLTPFLEEKALTAVFGKNLLEKEALEPDFLQLTGIEKNKPFECVGTRREVLAALKTFRKNGGRSLLTDRYQEWIDASQTTVEDILGEWEGENGLPEEFANYLKGKIAGCRHV